MSNDVSRIIETFCAAFDRRQEEILADYFEFLRFQTISAKAECSGELQLCAQWLCNFLRESGLETELWESPEGPPVVFAQWADGGKDAPTVLLYGHYDVQPVDPLDMWWSAPFEPHRVQDDIYARGAQDNKGQCLYFLYAVRSMLADSGRLPLNVKICIEGQEEIGSTVLQGLAEEKKESLKSDFLLVVDSFLKNIESPSISLGARGSTLMTVELTGSAGDLHSGLHGGLAYNPNRALVEVLSKMHDCSGKVSLPGFYDGVVEPSAAELEGLDLTFSEEEYTRVFKAKPNGGELEYQPAVRNTVRPTVEINGLYGGYAGPGVKMVIPAKAGAKLSTRLVPGQDPERINGLIADFIRANVPEGIAVDIQFGASGHPFRTKADSGVVQAVARAFTDVFGEPCKLGLDGVTIPPASKLAEASGAETVLIGCGLPEDNIHAPNEHFSIARLRLGFLLISRCLQILSGAAGE